MIMFSVFPPTRVESSSAKMPSRLTSREGRQKINQLRTCIFGRFRNLPEKRLFMAPAGHYVWLPKG